MDKFTIIWVPGSRPAKAAVVIDEDLQRACKTLRLYDGWGKVRKKFRIKQITFTDEVFAERFARSLRKTGKARDWNNPSLTPMHAHCVLPTGKKNWPYLIQKHVRC